MHRIRLLMLAMLTTGSLHTGRCVNAQILKAEIRSSRTIDASTSQQEETTGQKSAVKSEPLSSDASTISRAQRVQLEDAPRELESIPGAIKLVALDPVHAVVKPVAIEYGSSHSADNASSDMHEATGLCEEHEYPRYASHDPGRPRKPLWDRPGDIKRTDCPPIRYCEDDEQRAGWPHAVRPHAQCSINHHYVVGYVGGGSALGLPHNRPRTTEDGTWGMDYAFFPYPRTVFMRWTCGRDQGGLGAYGTDHTKGSLNASLHAGRAN